jgi:colanic acid/amylovoran biosynthesis protein
MKILIVNGYVRENKGDAALIYVLGHQLQDTFPDSHISVASMEDVIEHPTFIGFENVGSMRLYAAEENIWRPFRVLRKIFVGVIINLWPSLPYRNFLINLLPLGIRGELQAIEQADIVISASGGYLTSPDSFLGNLNIYFLIAPLRIATRLGKLLIMAPESFGPFGNDWQRTQVRKLLNSTQLIFVREDTSYTLLKELGVKESLMKRAIDSGFAHLADDSKETVPVGDDNQMNVGITARNWLKGEDQTRYEIALAKTIVTIERKYGAKITLVPQVTSNYQKDDDRIVETRIKEFAVKDGAHPFQIMDELDQNQIKELYSKFTFTIGTRFHSVIFSLTSYVPAIAIEYEHKTRGIMHDLNLDDWVIKIEDVTFENLNLLFDKLIANQETYRRHLREVMPNYIERTKEVPRMIKELYEERRKA